MIALTPGGMLAIRTGAASGLVVIDVDPANGGLEALDELVRRGLCPPTRYVHTGSGGCHLYYRHPGPHVRVPCSAGRLGPGIDIRADGGYVAAPPSIHPRTRKPYVWAAERPEIKEMAPALATACLPADSAPPTGVAAGRIPTLRSARAISYPDRLLKTLLDKVRNAPPGRTRVTLYGCAWRRVAAF